MVGGSWREAAWVGGGQREEVWGEDQREAAWVG